MIDGELSSIERRIDFEMSDADWKRIYDRHKLAEAARPEISNLVTLFLIFERGMDRAFHPA